MLAQISFRAPIVGHDGDHLQIAVRRLGRRRLLDKIGPDEGSFRRIVGENRVSDNVGCVKYISSARSLSTPKSAISL
jgi:hypothetical protein